MKSLFRGAFLQQHRAQPRALPRSLAACTTPNPQPLDRPGDLPPGFTAPMDKSAPVWPKAAWWAGFNAEELAPLEELAQKENLDIAQAAARVLQAEATDGVALSPPLSHPQRQCRLDQADPAPERQLRQWRDL